MESTEAQPKCPECGVRGVEHIQHKESAITSRGGDPWFDIAYCGKCGHVYGVFAKVTLDPSMGPLP